MGNRNVDKGREAENAVAEVLREYGMAGAERRAKRGGVVEVTCGACLGSGRDDYRRPRGHNCPSCDGARVVTVPADAGDLTGIPGVVVQVKWSGYKPLTEDMRRTEEQRRVAGADVGLLVRKRKGVGVTRAGEWDAYLPTWAVWRLMVADDAIPWPDDLSPNAPWRVDLSVAAELLTGAGYGTKVPA